MKKLCGCGTCRDAAERAVQLVCKMIDDNECSLFVYAVADVMFSVAREAAIEQVKATAEREGPIAAIETIGCYQNAGAEAVDEFRDNKDFTKVINDHLDAFNERRKLEAELPKGD